MHDFGSAEIVARPISPRPDLVRREEMPETLVAAKPEGASPIPRSNVGWRCRRASHVGALGENGFTQSMSRKGSRLDDGATERVFGHLKDEFFRGGDRDSFEEFKADLEAYARHWNNTRRQVKLGDLTPVEFRGQALGDAA